VINLLPTETRNSIMYARRNTYLRKWAVSLLAVIAALLVIVGVGFLFLKGSTNSYWKQVDQSKQNLQAQDQETVKAQVQDLTSSLKLVDQVLSKEVLFSKLLVQIGSVMPSGSILTNLSINQLDGGLDLRAAATDYQTATQVQVNLGDPNNKIFASSDLINVQCQSDTSVGGSAVNARYPCSVQVRALFAKENPFLFINDGAKETQ
jgi:hypothetical protein